ncbi:MAG: glycoside hydrolase family 31 protein [Chlorobi bacterium]|nr:glycoside hydrolase family 31 protein [Chlorobiota bacterium]
MAKLISVLHGNMKLFVFLLASMMILSCSQKVNLNSNSEWEVKPAEGKFSLQLVQKEWGKTFELTTKGDASGLFYITDKGTQYLTGRTGIETNNDSVYSALYKTTDSRKAVVTIKKSAGGCINIDLKVVPEKGVKQVGATIKSLPGEGYYGLMERTVDGHQNKSWSPETKASLDLRGQKVTMLVTPTLGIYEPFYVSTDGYGLMVNSIRPGKYDLAATDSTQVKLVFDDNTLNMTVVPGPNMTDVIKRLPKLTGQSFLPPEWAFRPLRWRDEHVNRKTYYDGTPNRAPYNSELVEDILMAQAYDIPIGTYWVDRPWAKGNRGWGDLYWDPVRFPNAQDMIKWLDKKDIKFLVWIAPWAADNLLKEGLEKGYMMPGMKKVLGENKKNGPWLIDLTKEDARQWYKKTLKDRLIKMGVAGFKMDRSEEIVSKIDTFTLWNGLKVHDIRNDYPRLYVKTAYEALKEIRGGNDFLAMPRAGFTGSQQYGVFWGGDIGAGELGLRTALIAVQRCSFMNFPIWGSDIGGYWKKPLSHINMARWLAFGAFTPIMEVGPLDNLAPWNMPYKPSYDTELIAIYRMYSIIHDELAGYSHKMAEKAAKTGMPIVRPLSLTYPHDKKAVKRWDEYMYGDNILVGIVWKNNQKKFEMYLPEGRWIDYWTGKEYMGNKTITIDCPDYKIPIFFTGPNPPKLPDPNKLYKESFKLASKKPNLYKLQKKEFGK